MLSVKKLLLNLIKITELTASDDCDDVLKTGLYYIGASGTLPSNYPSTATYSLMFCWMRGGLGYQLALRAGHEFFFRKRSGSPAVWSRWSQWDNYSQNATMTYTTNNYVNQTNFSRLKCVRRGKIAILQCNLQFSTSLPSNNTLYTIGNCNIHPTENFDITIPCQNNNSTIIFEIRTDGTLRVYNNSGTATGTGWFRQHIPFFIY